MNRLILLPVVIIVLSACDGGKFSGQNSRQNQIYEEETQDLRLLSLTLQPKLLEIQPGGQIFQFEVDLSPAEMQDELRFSLSYDGSEELGLGDISDVGLYTSPDQAIDGAVKLYAYLESEPDFGDFAEIRVLDSLFLECRNSNLPIHVNLYELETGTRNVPDFSEMEKQASFCMRQYDISARDYGQGFPGVPNLVEWFGLETKTILSIAEAGEYTFYLNSDDGSLLYIDGELLIDNDGQHAPREISGSIELSAGTYELRIDYFQGPRFQIALELFWSTPADPEKKLVPASVLRQPALQ